jgi:16S rRNA (cytidine1402-2'-O)-methyltransferase
MSRAASASLPNDLRAGRTFRGLVLVSTPIGNLEDISERARAMLRGCDLVLCEDTRRTGHLLNALQIKARLESLHDHNEDEKVPGVLARLHDNQTIALVSDAGTPLISDPGYRLVSAVIDAGLPISAVPGPNAALTALTLSGLPPLPYLFLGYPPPRQAARLETFGQLRAAERAGLSATLIWQEAPHRLLEMLADLSRVFAGRPSVVARELTKRFETVERGTPEALIETFTKSPARGEIIVLLGPSVDRDAEDLDGRLRVALASTSIKDAASLVSVATGLPRKIVYARALELRAEANS